jgi:hypothetical protein
MQQPMAEPAGPVKHIWIELVVLSQDNVDYSKIRREIFEMVKQEILWTPIILLGKQILIMGKNLLSAG